MKEVMCFVHVLKLQKGKPFGFTEIIQARFANVIFALVCGKRHDHDEEAFLKILHAADILIGTENHRG